MHIAIFILLLNPGLRVWGSMESEAGSLYVAQAGSKLKILPPPSSESWDYKHTSSPTGSGLSLGDDIGYTDTIWFLSSYI